MSQSARTGARAFEERSIASGKGIWGEPGFPRRGWSCIAVVDLVKDGIKCEACRSTIIRFAHVLSHPDVDDRLKVGCICAGYLIGDMGMARAGDERARALAGKRARWATRRWRMSRSGNWWIEHEGAVITVFKHEDRFCASVRGGTVAEARVLGTDHASIEAAKLAAFDAWVAGRELVSQDSAAEKSTKDERAHGPDARPGPTIWQRLLHYFWRDA